MLSRLGSGVENKECFVVFQNFSGWNKYLKQKRQLTGCLFCFAAGSGFCSVCAETIILLFAFEKKF